MPLTHLHIKRVHRGEDPGAWARALAEPGWMERSRALKEEPGSSWVRHATLSGREVVVKGRLLNTGSRWLKAALGYGHGDKHWRGAALLASKKIATARPLALAWGREGGVRVEVLVLEYLAGPTLLDWLAAASLNSRAEVRREHGGAAAVADHLFEMVAAGLFNRDHKPSNLIVLDAASTSPRIALIDCVGVRRQAVDAGPMLASLLIEPIGCGVAPRRALIMRFLTHYCRRTATLTPESGGTAEEVRADVRAHWRHVASLVAAHGDPRPRVDPLRRSPGGATV